LAERAASRRARLAQHEGTLAEAPPRFIRPNRPPLRRAFAF
jgi:hypothetical protein